MVSSPLPRRRFLSAGLSTLACATGIGEISRSSFLGAQERFDILIKGGHVFDPASGLSGVRDVAIRGKRIARVATDIPVDSADRILDASGKWVTPGLIDMHVHVFEGVAGVGITPDIVCVARGATTVVDAGSAGATTYPGFSRYVVDRSVTRVRAMIHLSSIGMASMRELPVLELADVERAEATINRHRDSIVGIKLRMTPNIGSNQQLHALGLARELADAVKLPIMVHIQRTSEPLRIILSELRSGDIITHCLRAEGSVLDEASSLRPEVLAARERGVRFDVGHGAGNFSFKTAERALEQGFVPDTISSDVHRGNFEGPVFDLVTTLSKFLHLGLSPERTIQCATENPARILGLGDGLGRLAEGSLADVAILERLEGEFRLEDSGGEVQTSQVKLVSHLTIHAGTVYAATEAEARA